ncbi:MAG TPA: HD domain-containing protein [Candidatus Limnocylindrales bacterium]
MTVPGRDDAAALLLSLDPPPWALRHARAVAEVAGWLAARAAGQGRVVDRRLVEAAALLHDVDKLLPATDPARQLRHGDGSAAWLTRQGHPELAPIVADHPVTRLVDATAFEAWLAGASLAARIVAYADKRAGQRLEPMGARFGSWARRYPDAPGWDATVRAEVAGRAARLEADACAIAGVAPDEVGRLRWTGAAFRAANAARTRVASAEARIDGRAAS